MMMEAITHLKEENHYSSFKSYKYRQELKKYCRIKTQFAKVFGWLGFCYPPG